VKRFTRSQDEVRNFFTATSWRFLQHAAKLVLAIGCAGLLPAAASAAYPERPVTIVVPFAPGGANDVVVRLIQGPLAEALGQPIIVENRGGAGGNIGIGQVAHAADVATRKLDARFRGCDVARHCSYRDARGGRARIGRYRRASRNRWAAA
jgi:Tripartite tricarboxylate transporter family receptor